MQSDNHYRSLCSDDDQTSIPRAWLHRTETKSRQFYRGGGDQATATCHSNAPISVAEDALNLPDSPDTQQDLLSLPPSPFVQDALLNLPASPGPSSALSLPASHAGDRLSVPESSRTGHYHGWRLSQ
jgi:hypothetical protein